MTPLSISTEVRESSTTTAPRQRWARVGYAAEVNTITPVECRCPSCGHEREMHPLIGHDPPHMLTKATARKKFLNAAGPEISSNSPYIDKVVPLRVCYFSFTCSVEILTSLPFFRLE
jgi:hypothetical protein